MTSSRIDWNRYLKNLKDLEFTNDKIHVVIFNSVISLARLQKFMFECRIPEFVRALIDGGGVWSFDEIPQELYELKDMQEVSFTSLNVDKQLRLNRLIMSLEHILLHHLKQVESSIHADDNSLHKLRDLLMQFPNDAVVKQQAKNIEANIKRWNYFAPLVPILEESAHAVRCCFSKKVLDGFAQVASAQGSKVRIEPEHVGIGEQGHETVVCDYCQSSVEKNRFGQREELLICKDCGNKAHPSCLNYLPELVEQIRADDSWQCIDCKACVICNGTGDPDTLLFCDACDKGYHMQCHAPKLEKMPSGKWACASCVEKGKSVSTPSGTQQQPVFIVDAEVNSHAKRNVTGNGEKLLSTVPVQKIEPQIAKTKAAMVPQPVLSVHQPGAVYHPTGLTFTQPPIVSPVAIPPVQHLPLNQPQMIPVNYAVLPNTSTPPAQTVLGRGVHNNLTHILNPKLPLPDVRSSIREDVLRALPPDVADWTVQDVAYYFKSHGYVLESKLLEEQEIDGRAMLLMSRNDCLTGLHIKLGPALKIYHMHIHKLQKRTEFLG